MPAANQSGEREIVRHLARLVFGPGVQQLLNALPAFMRHQRHMRALVGLTIPIEVAHVQALSQDLVNGATLERTATEQHALGVHLPYQRLDGVAPLGEPFKYVRHHAPVCLLNCVITLANRADSAFDGRARQTRHSPAAPAAFSVCRCESRSTFPPLFWRGRFCGFIHTNTSPPNASFASQSDSETSRF